MPSQRLCRATSSATRLGLVGAILLVGVLVSRPASSQTVRQRMCVTNGQVYATAIANNTLYVGGDFTQAGPATGCAVGVDATTGTPIQPYPLVGNPQLIGGLGKVGAVASDGSGGWYLGGLFPAVSGQPRNNLAHIDGSGNLMTWSPDVNGEVKAIAVGGGVVYVGGAFTSIDGQMRNYIAAFDAGTGTLLPNWTPNANNLVNALAVGSGVVYAGGTFTNIGTASRSRLAALDMATGNATGWSPSPFQVVSVNALLLSGGHLYVGGATNIGYIADYPTAGTGFIVPIWTATGPQPSYPVNALALGATTLYAGGDAGQMLALNTTNGAYVPWSPASNNTVRALFYDSGTVYVGGDFTTMGGQTRTGLAAVDATSGGLSSWDPRPAGLYGWHGVYSIGKSGTAVFAGGDFCIMNAQPRSRLAAFDLTSGGVTPWNPSSGGPIRAIVTANNTVYVGGSFQSVNGQTRHNVAALDMLFGTLLSWNPDVWDPGFPSAVYALATNGSAVWIGGAFSQVNGLPHPCIAAVNASSGAVTGFNGSANGAVLTLAFKTSETFPFTTLVYGGGSFTQANGIARNRIAAWNGDTGGLSFFDPNANGNVNTISYTSCGADCGTLWVGGVFTSIGGTPRSFLASIDASTGLPTSWNPGCNGQVYSLLVRTSVYVGGNFTTIAGAARNRIAAVDPGTGVATSWNPGAQREVFALNSYGGTVFAGGFFNTIYGLPYPCLVGVSDGTVTAVDQNPAPMRPTVLRVSPNPFATQTALQFDLARSEDASVAVYDVTGRLIRKLYRGRLAAGERRMTWDGRNAAGTPVASGTYFLRVETPTECVSSKVHRIR